MSFIFHVVEALNTDRMFKEALKYSSIPFLDEILEVLTPFDFSRDPLKNLFYLLSFLSMTVAFKQLAADI